MNILALAAVTLLPLFVDDRSEQFDERRKENAYGATINGLQCGLHLMSAAKHGLADQFSSLQDMRLDMWLSPKGEQRLFLPAEDERGWSTPKLFDLEIQRANGEPLDLPRWSFRRGSDVRWNDPNSDLRQKRNVWRRRHTIADWFGWQSIVLANGTYRIRLAYMGAPDPDPRRPAQSVPEAWRGTVKSGWRTFDIVGSAPDVEWSEEVDGLRIGQELLPRGGRYFFGETIRPRVIVENVSEEILYFDRDLEYSQADEIHVHSHGVNRSITGGTAWASGTHPILRWYLSPGQRAMVYPARLHLELADPPGAASLGGIQAPPGEYTVGYSVSLFTQPGADTEGRAWQGRRIFSVGTIIELLRRDVDRSD